MLTQGLSCIPLLLPTFRTSRADHRIHVHAQAGKQTMLQLFESYFRAVLSMTQSVQQFALIKFNFNPKNMRRRATLDGTLQRKKGGGLLPAVAEDAAMPAAAAVVAADTPVSILSPTQTFTLTNPQAPLKYYHLLRRGYAASILLCKRAYSHPHYNATIPY